MYPIADAPQDGTILLSYWGDTPVFIAWLHSVTKSKTVGYWPFKRTIAETREAGWYILLLNRNGQYVIHGNFKPYKPSYFAYIPEFGDNAD